MNHLEQIAHHYRDHGQDHVLRHADELSGAEREAFLDQLASIDLDLLDHLIRDVLPDRPRQSAAAEDIFPETVIELPARAEDHQRDAAARAAGEERLKAGTVAVLTVAGGQGTRLGFHGPKGCYPIGPVSNRTLFEIHAHKIRALGDLYGGRTTPWYIMTSAATDAPTRAAFAAHDYYGLSEGDVFFFEQRMLPVVDLQGKLLLDAPHHLCTSPDGHGGTVRGLRASGALDDMKARGIEEIFYFQVDNPLVKIADPIFLGHHRLAESEMSSKVVRKTAPDELLGLVCRVGGPAGRIQVIEYSEVPPEIAAARGPSGDGLKFWAGSIAIHVMDLGLLARLTEDGSETGGEPRLPFHRAVKSVPYLNEAGELVQPAEPNAVKFESFIFDALPLARKAITVECGCEEEFAPLKNATGPDSVETCRAAMIEQYGRWLESCGVHVPRRPAGTVDGKLEISPLLALNAELLRSRIGNRVVMMAGETITLQA